MIIRKLRTHQEYLDAEDIQRTVWHFPEREVIPLNELVVAQKNGGHVMGAFDDGRMVAFCFGVPGFHDGKVYHYSRMLGVLPEYQDRGLGHEMKLVQRKLVLEQGLDLVKWTFDPLQSRNAYLNIEKLGCVIRAYLVNVYGESGSRFNQGLETDRFVPEWWIASKRVKDRLAGRTRPPSLAESEAYAPAIDCARTHDGWLEAKASRPRLRDRRVSVEIPDAIDALKRHDGKSAQAWRFRTRDAFVAYFKRGYVVCGYATGKDGAHRRNLYLLEKGHRVR